MLARDWPVPLTCRDELTSSVKKNEMGLLDYDIKETLAVSSRSVVRRAVRKADGLPVIIKSPSQEVATSEDFWQFEFEFRLLQKLGVPATDAS